MAIKRIWHGWTTKENADKYQNILNTEVLPKKEIVEKVSKRVEGIANSCASPLTLPGDRSSPARLLRSKK